MIDRVLLSSCYPCDVVMVYVYDYKFYLTELKFTNLPIIYKSRIFNSVSISVSELKLFAAKN